jgi:hypothetical protein
MSNPSPWSGGDRAQRELERQILDAARKLARTQAEEWRDPRYASACVGAAYVLLESFQVHRLQDGEREKYLDAVLAHMRAEILRAAREK